MWRFVAPGLYRSEKGAFLPFLLASPFMFILGASFAFYVVTPLAYDFFLGFQQFGAGGEAVPAGEPQNRPGLIRGLPGLGAGIPEPDDQVHRGLWACASSCRFF